MENLKIGPVPALDMLKFNSIGIERKRIINKGKINTEFVCNTNDVANEMYPLKQIVKVTNIIELAKGVKQIVLNSIDGKGLANFRAGQYIYITARINDVVVSRAYSLCSSPKMARNGEYRITVFAKNKGLLSKHLLNDITTGEELEISCPQGNFTYSSIRDEGEVFGICDNSGISSFYSMAQAILDGEEEFELLVYYCVDKDKDILYSKELDEIQSKTNKFKIIYMSNEEDTNYTEGPLKIKELKKDLYKPVTFYFCGSSKIIDYLNNELSVLKLPNKFFRYEKHENIEKEKKYQLFKLTVVTNSEILILPCQSNDTLLTTLGKEGINVPRGHDYKCKLIYGKVRINGDIRVKTDVKYNYISLDNTYPEDDVKITLNN